jgi:hypothetical protein
MLNLLLESESSIIFPILCSTEGGTFEELQLHSCRCSLVLWVCPQDLDGSWEYHEQSSAQLGRNAVGNFEVEGLVQCHDTMSLEVWSLILAVLSACKCTSEEEYLWGFPTGIVGTRQSYKIHWSSVLIFPVPSWSTLGLAWFGWQSIWRVLNHHCLVMPGPMIMYPPGTKITCGWLLLDAHLGCVHGCLLKD